MGSTSGLASNLLGFVLAEPSNPVAFVAGAILPLLLGLGASA